MVKFGPAGRSDEDVAANLSYAKLFEKINDLGLDAVELPFTFGVKMTSELAQELNQKAKELGIQISGHAPYYINFANPDKLKIDGTISYLMQTVKKVKELGGDRVVFHPGSELKQKREDAVNNVLENLKVFLSALDEEKIDGVYICPETMGKHGQIGTPDEVAEMCKLDRRIIPTLDFGHINAFYGGSLKTKQDFIDIIKKFTDIGKTEIHIHFSKIEYGAKGEIKHLTFDDEKFGPDYKLMIDALKEFPDVNFRVVCESSGTQSKDSKIMQEYFKKVF